MEKISLFQLLQKADDIIILNDVTDEEFPSFVGPVRLSYEGFKTYRDILFSLKVKYDKQHSEAILLLDDFMQTEEDYNRVSDFFFLLAGAVSENLYDQMILNLEEQIFVDFLDLIEFDLIKDGQQYALVDRQGANLGEIESRRYERLVDIIDDLSVYVEDYIVAPLEEQARQLHIPIPVTWEGFVAIRDKFPAANQWDLQVLQVLTKDYPMINLDKCYTD